MASSKRSRASRSKSSSKKIAASPVAPLRDAAIEAQGPSIVSTTPELPPPALPEIVAAQTTPRTVPEVAPPPVAPSPEELRRLVAQLAYSRAENLGFGRTNPIEDWLWAEQEVNRRMQSRAA